MIKGLKKNLFLFFMLLFVSSCNAYIVHEKIYYNRQSALSQEDSQSYTNLNLSEIFPIKVPINKTALIAAPSHEPTEGNSVNVMGCVSGSRKVKLRKIGLSKKEIDYINTISRERYEFIYKAMVKRNLFKKVNLVYNDSPENTSYDEYDFLIFYRHPTMGAIEGWHIVTGIGKMIHTVYGPLPGWHVMSKGWPNPKPINIDCYQQPSYIAVNIWLKSLEELVNKN